MLRRGLERGLCMIDVFAAGVVLSRGDESLWATIDKLTN